MPFFPQLGASAAFNAGDGLAQNCVVYATGGLEELSNLAGGEFGAIGGTGTGLMTVYGQHGPALNTDGTANGFITYGTAANFSPGAGDFAFACLLRQDALVGGFPLFISGGLELLAGSGSTVGALNVRLNGGVTSTSLATGLNDGMYHMAVFSRRDGVGTWVVDGRVISATAMATSITATSGLTVGKRGTIATYYAIPGIGMTAYWSRCLSPDEIMRLTADPFILTRERGWVYRAPAAGGAMDGTISISVTNSGALQGNAGLTGLNSIAITNTGLLRGSGVLSGLNSVSIDNSGLLGAMAPISGSQTITISSSGSLTPFSPGAMMGSISVSFSNFGTLTGTRNTQIVNVYPAQTAQIANTVLPSSPQIIPL